MELMKYYLKTKEECDAIVARNEAFIKAERVVEGFNVCIYDYRLASISDFVNEEAFELRGYTFVENPETGEWEGNILLNKFFNINQTTGEPLVGIYGAGNKECEGEPNIVCRKNSELYERVMAKAIRQYEKVLEPAQSWMYEDVKDKKIIGIANKEDGSIISFVKLPNGSIRAKSKTSFESDQAKMAQKILDNNFDLAKEILIMLDDGQIPIFEVVGPDNQIVLEYQNTELVLLQIRDYDGIYFGEKTLNTKSALMGVRLAEQFDMTTYYGEDTLDRLLIAKETNQDNIEGWVITFEDGQMAKIKTDKYIQLHGLIGPDAFRENLLIQTILDGNMDDVIAQLVPGEKKDRMVDMDRKVVKDYNHLCNEFKSLRGTYFGEYREDRKKFALKFSKTPLFGYVMKSLKESFRDVNQVAEVQVRAYLDRVTNSLGKAKDYIEGL